MQETMLEVPENRETTTDPLQEEGDMAETTVEVAGAAKGAAVTKRGQEGTDPRRSSKGVPRT